MKKHDICDQKIDASAQKPSVLDKATYDEHSGMGFKANFSLIHDTRDVGIELMPCLSTQMLDAI